MCLLHVTLRSWLAQCAWRSGRASSPRPDTAFRSCVLPCVRQDGVRDSLFTAACIAQSERRVRARVKAQAQGLGCAVSICGVSICAVSICWGVVKVVAVVHPPAAVDLQLSDAVTERGGLHRRAR
jgi:hypothetical protein